PFHAWLAGRPTASCRPGSCRSDFFSRHGSEFGLRLSGAPVDRILAKRGRALGLAQPNGLSSEIAVRACCRLGGRDSPARRIYYNRQISYHQRPAPLFVSCFVGFGSPTAAAVSRSKFLSRKNQRD